MVGEKNVKGNTIFKEILGNIDNNIDKTQTYNDGILYFVSNTNTDAGKSWLTLGMVAVSEDKKEELSEYTNLGQLFMLK